SGDSEEVNGFNIYISEQRENIFTDDLFDRHINNGVFPLDFEKARNIGWHLDKGKFTVVLFIPRIDGHHPENQELVHQNREGMVAIKYHWRQHGINRLVKILLDDL